VLLGVWLALLAGLIVGIKVMGTLVTPPPAPPSAPKLDPATLEAQWPQIVAHAAAPPLGRADARYTLAEFGDFQCPECGKAQPVLENIVKQYPAQVNLIFLHRPIPQIHQWALPSGQAAEVAAAQGRFWPMYDVLYAHQNDLEPGFYADYAAKAGLDKAGFQKAFDGGQGRDRVKAAARFAESLGIEGTPTILVHDNVAHTLAVYVGTDTRANVRDSVRYWGLDKLLAAPPWAK
jgi:protein-disulfide isomerase